MQLRNMTSVNTPLITRFTIHQNRKALGFFKDELNSIPMKEFVGFSPKWYAFLCTGKVDTNIVHHSRPAEKKMAKVVKRKVAMYLN